MVPNSPQITSDITILSYTAESDVVYAPSHKHVESRHRKIWQYYNTGDVLRARDKAFRSFQKEVNRFTNINKEFPIDSSPYSGLKLYFEYRLNDAKQGNKDKVHRFYLFDGEDVTQMELMGRMKQELMFLRDAGVEIELIPET